VRINVTCSEPLKHEGKLTIMKRTLHEAVMLILIAVFFALVVNGLRPQGIRIKSGIIKKPAKTQQQDIIKEISIGQAIEQFKNSTALFVDARDPYYFAKGHIQGATNLPEQQFDEYIDNFTSQTDPNIKIITYCDGIHCDLAENLAEKLFFAGYENVYCLKDGWNQWNEKLQPVESQ
jgi:rhodanese-related sulfurtransferase